MPTHTHNLGLFAVGDTFCIDIDNVTIPGVRNNGPGIAQNVTVTLTIPAGISLDPAGSTVSKGIFNDGTGIWSLGSLIKNEVATGSFCFEVTDDCDSPYIIEFNVDSDACDCLFANNTFTVVASGVSCCAINNCRPYKVYTALLTQSGTDDPDVIVLENTLSGNISWVRDFGKYVGTLAGEFTIDKTFMLASFAQSGNDAVTLRVAPIGLNDISIWGTDAGNSIVDLDTLDGPVNLEVRVYP